MTRALPKGTEPQAFISVSMSVCLDCLLRKRCASAIPAHLVLLPPSQITLWQTGSGVCSYPRSGCKSGHGLKGVASEYASLRSFEASLPGLNVTPEAEQAVRRRIDEIKQAMYALDPTHVQAAKLQSAIERAAKYLENKRQAVNTVTEQQRKAEVHFYELQEQQHQLSALASKEKVLPDVSDMDEDHLNGWYHDDSEQQSWNGGWQPRWR